MHDSLSDLPDATREKLGAYLDALLDENQRTNLTSVRTRDEAWKRHIAESASLVPLLGTPSRVLDVGSGGGLPGMVLGICRPDIHVTLLEATEKKARFLESVRQGLKVENVDVVCERAEVAARPTSPLRESYDLVTARAVAPLATLLEITIPFLRVGGTLLAIKGGKAAAEVTAAGRAFKLLRARLKESLVHPSGTVLIIEKTSPTPAEFPRRVGEPKKRPL